MDVTLYAMVITELLRELHRDYLPARFRMPIQVRRVLYWH